MKTISIIVLVAAATAVYMMTSSKICVLESQFWALMTKYRKL